MVISEVFKYCNVLFYLLILSSSIHPSEVPRPRGVSLSRASLYPPNKDFVCFDGSLTIPFTHVNDDYCDCPDASDEPGTSACPHGTFHCTNAGHKPLNIASSRVNDGVCDCCDASDEYANNDRIKCVNNCNELGRNAREEAQKKAELIRAGKQLRTEMSERGIQLKQQKKERLTELQKNKAEAEKIKLAKEEVKKQAEELENAALKYYRDIEEEERKKRDEIEALKTREEAKETFIKYDSNGDGKIDLSELKTRQSFDKDRNGEVSDEEAKYFLNEQDSVSEEDFITLCWSKIKPFLMMDSGLFKPPTPKPGEKSAQEVNEEEEDEEEEETEAVADAGDHEEIDDLEDGDDIESDGDDDEDAAATEKQDETIPSPPVYDEETQKLIDQASDARKQYSDVEKDVHDFHSQIKDIEDYLEKDFGPDEEFAALEGECFEYTDYEYIYKLCPFDKAVQQPKANSLETRLGIWSKWAGPSDSPYDTMLYDRGQSCWNGPQRSTRVNVICGSENKLTAVSEPNRCEYQFDFITPAACRETPTEQSEDLHDEL